MGFQRVKPCTVCVHLGSNLTQGSQFFYEKMTVSGELCCVALPFCCVVVVALPFSASLGVIVHV